jgi:hypothetical protein
VPNNVLAKLQSGIVVGTSPLKLDVDVPATKVSGAVTVNGGAVPSTADPGLNTVNLVNAAGDSAVLANVPTTGSYSALVVPGTYDLAYKAIAPGTSLPTNTSAQIRSGIVVGTSPVSLNVDVPGPTVSVSLTSNAPAAVPPSGLPRNSAAKLRSAIVVGTSPLSLNLDIPTTAVSGTATIDGAAITTSAQRAFLLYLQAQSDAGDRVQVVNYPQDGTFSVSALPGTYDLYYSRQGDIGTVIPNNVSTRIRSGIVVGASPVALDVDVRGTTVSGAITVNGLATSGASGDLAFVALSDGTSDIAASSALLTSATSATGTYSTFVLPGKYELYYVLYRSSGATLPTNTNTHLGCFVVP